MPAAWIEPDGAEPCGEPDLALGPGGDTGEIVVRQTVPALKEPPALRALSSDSRARRNPELAVAVKRGTEDFAGRPVASEFVADGDGTPAFVFLSEQAV
jgi:hypothetical protein